jgi:hypothetical protein
MGSRPLAPPEPPALIQREVVASKSRPVAFAAISLNKMNRAKVVDRSEFSLGVITKPIGSDPFTTIAKGAHKTES